MKPAPQAGLCGPVVELGNNSLPWEYKLKTSIQGLGREVPVNVSPPNNTSEFKEIRVPKQISHITGPPAQAFSFRQQQRWDLANWELYRFGCFLKLRPSLICLPCRQTEGEKVRQRYRETSGRACHKASQSILDVSFNFMHDSSHICFPSLSPLFFLPLMLPFLPSYTQPPPFLCLSISGVCIQMMMHPETSGWDWGMETMLILNLPFLSVSEALWPCVSNLFCSADAADWSDAGCSRLLEPWTPAFCELNGSSHLQMVHPVLIMSIAITFS